MAQAPNPLFETLQYHLYLLSFMCHYIDSRDAACGIKIYILSSRIIGSLLWMTVQDADVTEY